MAKYSLGMEDKLKLFKQYNYVNTSMDFQLEQIIIDRTNTGKPGPIADGWESQEYNPGV